MEYEWDDIDVDYPAFKNYGIILRAKTGCWCHSWNYKQCWCARWVNKWCLLHCETFWHTYRVEGSNRCSISWVKFTDSSIGKTLQTKLARLYKPGICRSWTPILEITRMFKVHINGTYQVKRKQFPLQLSAAKTVHKSQGSTLTNAVVHFGSRKNDHVHYVGLSRVTCLENFVGYDELVLE